MDGRSRIKGTIERTPIDRMPLWSEELFTDTERKWIKQGMPPTQAEREDFFGYDQTHLFIDTSMRFEEKIIEETDETITVADKFGFVATRNKLTPGIHYHENPIKQVEDWRRHKERLSVDFGRGGRFHEVSYFKPFVEWPGWQDARTIYQRKANTGRYVSATAYGPWETLWRLRGFSEAMMDLYENREMVEDIAGHYVSFLIEVIRKGLETGIRLDGVIINEDLGINTGPLFSPKTIRSIFIPTYKMLGTFLAKQDVHFIVHSCGDITELIPDFIEAGVNVLNPLQATVMDVVELKPKYGEQLTFLGNINARIMHDREAIRAELGRKLPVALQGGGYIFVSDHSIPSQVTLADYQFILQEARRLGACR
jgi:uroporphyrinogen decarboxylase